MKQFFILKKYITKKGKGGRRRRGQRKGKAEEKYKVSFAEKLTVYIADATRDVEASKIGGATSVGVASGRASSLELREAGADLVLSSLTSSRELIDFITALA